MPYEILPAIGSGGMREVHKARNTRLDRTVAIKIYGAEERALAMERVEGEILSRRVDLGAFEDV